jgi:hypothetical protein
MLVDVIAPNLLGAVQCPPQRFGVAKTAGVRATAEILALAALEPPVIVVAVSFAAGFGVDDSCLLQAASVAGAPLTTGATAAGSRLGRRTLCRCQ